MTTLVVTDRPSFFYSIISAAYLLSAVLFSIMIGRWVDRTRNVRITFLVCNMAVIFGNILYSVHHSPWFLVVGRFLCGIGGPLRSVMSGEVSRCFPTDQVTRKFSLMGTAFSLGFILGPGVNFAFKDLDIRFGLFHLTFANAAGFYMAALFMTVQVVVFLTVTDLSKEYDLKADLCYTTRSLADVPYPGTASNFYCSDGGVGDSEARPIDVPPSCPYFHQYSQNRQQSFVKSDFLSYPECGQQHRAVKSFSCSSTNSKQIPTTKDDLPYSNQYTHPDQYTHPVRSFSCCSNHLQRIGQKQALTEDALLKKALLVGSNNCNSNQANTTTTAITVDQMDSISINGSLNDLSITSTHAHTIPHHAFGGCRTRSSIGAESRISTYTQHSSCAFHQKSFLGFHKSIAMEKIEKPTLFPQTFTRADAMLSVSVMLVGDQLSDDCVGLLDPDAPLPTTCEILKQIGSSVDAMIVFFLSFFMYFWMVAFDMWLPMMIIDELDMGVTELNGIVFGFGCISAVILLLLSWKQFDDQAMFKLSLICVLCLGLMEVIFGSMKLFKQPLYVNVVLWVVWGTLFAVVVVMDEVFLIGILAKMTSSRIQTFNESLRLAMTRAGALIALVTAAMLFEYVEYLCLAGVVFSVVVFMVLVCRHKTFKNPTLIIR